MCFQRTSKPGIFKKQTIFIIEYNDSYFCSVLTIAKLLPTHFRKQ